MRYSVAPMLLLCACRSEPSPSPTAASVAPSAVVPTPTAPPELSAQPTAQVVEAPLEVKLAALLDEYKSNELRADAQFKSKLVRAVGTVRQVGHGPPGAYVTLGTGAPLELPLVQCLLADPADPVAAAINAGGKATFQGRVERLLGNLMVQQCEVNPVMHLCRRLKDATSANRCTVDAETGDASGIVFEEDTKADTGTIGVLACVGANENGTAGERYAGMLEAWAKKAPKQLIVGSPRAACYVLLSGEAKRKLAPFPEPLRAKVQAFFAAL